MPEARTLSFRLPADQAAELNEVAEYDGRPVADEIREGIKMLLEQRASDEEFKRRVRASLEKAQKRLNDLGEGAIADRMSVPDLD